MELWDLYNANGDIVGTDHIRGEKLPDNCYHLVVHIWIKNSDGKFLISRRSATRPTSPLKWETVGGSVLKGETSLQGALREVKEEIGIDLNAENGKLVFRQMRGLEVGNPFDDILDVWFFNYDGDAALENAPTDEVCETKWTTFEEVKELFDNGEIVKNLSYFCDVEFYENYKI